MLDQDDLLKKVTDINFLKKAAEGSMEKRQALINRHQPNQDEDKELRHKIAIQIVKASMPGYKRTKGELNDEADLVRDVYIDNIVKLITEARIDELKSNQNQVGYDVGGITMTKDDVEDRIAELTKQGGLTS